VTCRTCKFLDVLPDSRGRIIPRANKGYRCLYPIPADHALPASVTIYFRFQWPPTKSSMAPDDGEGCPQHVLRKEADQ
jgi:hypothetical protein